MVSLMCYLVQIIDKLAHAVVSWTLAPHCFALDELDTCFAPVTKVFS